MNQEFQRAYKSKEECLNPKKMIDTLKIFKSGFSRMKFPVRFMGTNVTNFYII
jgi:hypothetical protein